MTTVEFNTKLEAEAFAHSIKDCGWNVWIKQHACKWFIKYGKLSAPTQAR